jgi:hypothetical protein
MLTLSRQALVFDQQRASFSVGAHVRDAACYVCWAFARAYCPTVLRTHVETLAPRLVCVSLYDREVHVRRAASAAFQENVGRQGIFPRGIEIVTAADFFIVGNRSTAFLNAGRQVAVFEEYHPYCLSHILQRSINHWDADIRQIAAQALGILVEVKPTTFEYVFAHLVLFSIPVRLGDFFL